MKLRDIAEMGHLCGIETIGSAIYCAQCHWDTYPKGAFDYTGDTLCVDYLGPERCRALDAELEACFDKLDQDTTP